MSRPMPYVPMHEKRADVSKERMAAILAKHAKPKEEVMPHSDVPKPVDHVDAGAASAENTPLEWEKPLKGATGVYTMCKRYSCSKVTVAGRVSYEVWRCIPELWFAQIAVGLDSFEMAKQAAQADLAKRRE